MSLSRDFGPRAPDDIGAGAARRGQCRGRAMTCWYAQLAPEFLELVMEASTHPSHSSGLFASVLGQLHSSLPSEVLPREERLTLRRGGGPASSREALDRRSQMSLWTTFQTRSQRRLWSDSGSRAGSLRHGPDAHGQIPRLVERGYSRRILCMDCHIHPRSGYQSSSFLSFSPRLILHADPSYNKPRLATTLPHDMVTKQKTYIDAIPIMSEESAQLDVQMRRTQNVRASPL